MSIYTTFTGLTNTIANNGSTTNEYKTEVDDTGSGVTYIGKAKPGSLNSSSVWKIKKITESGIDVTINYANGSEAYDKVWDNRTSYSYS